MLTKSDKMLFVLDLTRSVSEQILSLIRENKVPEDWDGHELRELLADKFAAQTTALSRSRKKAYRNAVLVNNL